MVNYAIRYVIVGVNFPLKKIYFHNDLVAYLIQLAILLHFVHAIFSSLLFRVNVGSRYHETKDAVLDGIRR